MGLGCPCPPVRNDIVTLRHLFIYIKNQEEASGGDESGAESEKSSVGEELEPSVIPAVEEPVEGPPSAEKQGGEEKAADVGAGGGEGEGGGGDEKAAKGVKIG